MAFLQRLLTTKMCFVAGTLVLTESGLRGIESVRAGEKVWSRSEVTSVEGWQPVVDTFTTHPDTLYTLRLDADGDGVSDEETLTCTGEHPFWVEEMGAFVPAEEIRLGWRLLRARGSGQVTVLGIESTRAPPGQTYTTYNFEVATDHTYFVGKAGVWVHNEGKDCTKIFSMVHRSARALGGVDNLKARRFDVLADVRRKALLSGEKIAHKSWRKSAHEVSDKMLTDFASGGFDLVDDFPTVSRWDQEFFFRPPGWQYGADLRPRPANMLAMGDIVLHHNAPKALMELLKDRGDIPAGFDLDMVPGVIMDKEVHANMHNKDGLNTLLKSLRSQTDLESPQLAEQVFNFYTNNGQEAQAKLLKAFFTRIGINFE